MPIVLAGPPNSVSTAINNFNAGYHFDYQHVGQLSANFFSTATPDPVLAVGLATTLAQVLRNYGAGLRKAPNVHTIAHCSAVLMQPQLYSDLQTLRRNGIGSLSVSPAGTRAVASGLEPADLDSMMVRALSVVSAGLLVGNTNVTYPMKAVMLLTGCIPAFDSQVREGMTNGGFTSMGSTRMMLPEDVASPTAKKITRLGYLLGNSWTQTPRLRSEVAQSNYPWLQNEPARVFDVLFFMQANGRPVLTWVAGGPGRWYDLP